MHITDGLDECCLLRARKGRTGTDASSLPSLIHSVYKIACMYVSYLTTKYFLFYFCLRRLHIGTSLVVKNPPFEARDMSLIPGWGTKTPCGHGTAEPVCQG